MKNQFLYLAGGCFWGLEKYMEGIGGVIEAVSGYANGVWKEDRKLTYRDVCTGLTGFRETVRVEFDPDKISPDALLLAFFHVIDPTVQNRQGHDVGSQYQTGIYYVNQEQENLVRRIVETVKPGYPEFYVEVEPLKDFYEAEEEHQNYLTRNPGGYCHISAERMACAASMKIDPGNYPKPEESEIRKRLTELEYYVTQQAGTERPFTNAYWNLEEESPNKVRYCINSASLKFIPFEKMEEEGYGYLMEVFG